MHFRKIVADVVREAAAQNYTVDLDRVTAEQISDYLTFPEHGSRYAFVRDIFHIVFSVDETDNDRIKVVDAWLRRKAQILAVIQILN